ncbi:MAG: hypothetical protein M3069_31860 [Chloroflexota bacterium]|nr:hypothetical protein [Chloroflexota bacterium]
MQRFRFPIAVAVTSLALVAALIGAGGLVVGNALANGPFSGGGPGPWAAGQNGWQINSLPPELAGLVAVPAGERFSHFRGVRVQLTDKDNNPLTVDVTPGTATTVTPTSLTVTANDGSTRSFALSDKTIVRGKSGAQGGSQAASTTTTIAQNDKVVVATLNNSTTATAVMGVSPDGFGPRGPWGPGR